MFSKPELNPFGTGAKVDVFITNYESLKKFFVAEVPRGELRLKDIRFKPQISMFKSVIIDEAHRLKDPSTQQSKFSKGIVTGKEFILALTGTPIVNTQEDLVSILGVLDRLKDFGGASMFRAKWLNKEKLPELGERMKETCFIRRRKSEVLKDLPPKLRSIFQVELTNQEEYDHALNDLKSYLIEYKQKTNAEAARLVRMKALVQIGILKGISARGKLATVIEQVREVINAGEKIILFCHLREIGEALKQSFPDACVIKGGMSADMKQANIDRFQKDPEARVIICSIKAAGVGITLTASSRVGFAELPWHPADLDQCEDRAHRIGQKDSVQCTYFLGQGSIDNHIYRIINRKREISNLVTGDHDEIEVKIQNELFETLLKEV
jgi:SWI/SNF-related matrix-associated actin-dependent regulator 1 of chromatin subfamily A